MLIVGHTHIDIDQIFGVYSRALTREEALSLPGIERVLKGAFRLKANAPETIEMIEYVHDWESYYAPCLDPHFKRFGMDSKSGEATRVFKFKVDDEQREKMYYKDYMTSSATKPRPLHAGKCYKPESDARAASVLGDVWQRATPDEKHDVLTNGLLIGDSTYDRRTRLWHTELVDVPGIIVKAPSPGISLFVADPVGEPKVAPVPERWYKKNGDRTGDIFGAIKRTIEAMIAADYFKFDSESERWWRSYLTMHQPRDDGGCAARDFAHSVPRTWPRAAPTVSTLLQPAPALANNATERRMADQIQHSDYRGSVRERAQAALDEQHPTLDLLSPVVGQIIVAQFFYTGAGGSHLRVYQLALARVKSIHGAGTGTKYNIRWMCRSERGMQRQRDSFSLAGKYRESRSSDFKCDEDEPDESDFDVDQKGILCILAKTRTRGEDVPVTALTASGMIPNAKLASGLTMREFIAKAISEQPHAYGNFSS